MSVEPPYRLLCRRETHRGPRSAWSLAARRRRGRRGRAVARRGLLGASRCPGSAVRAASTSTGRSQVDVRGKTVRRASRRRRSRVDRAATRARRSSTPDATPSGRACVALVDPSPPRLLVEPGARGRPAPRSSSRGSSAKLAPSAPGARRAPWRALRRRPARPGARDRSRPRCLRKLSATALAGRSAPRRAAAAASSRRARRRRRPRRPPRRRASSSPSAPSRSPSTARTSARSSPRGSHASSASGRAGDRFDLTSTAKRLARAVQPALDAVAAARASTPASSSPATSVSIPPSRPGLDVDAPRSPRPSTARGLRRPHRASSR